MLDPEAPLSEVPDLSAPACSLPPEDCLEECGDPDCALCNYNEPPSHFGSGFMAGISAALIVALVAFAGVGSYHQEKHTGKVRIISGLDGYHIMERQNHEVFVMQFDDHRIEMTGVYEDITYTDVNATTRRLVKALPYVAPEPPEVPLQLLTCKKGNCYFSPTTGAGVVR